MFIFELLSSIACIIIILYMLCYYSIQYASVLSWTILSLQEPRFKTINLDYSYWTFR